MKCQGEAFQSVLVKMVNYLKEDRDKSMKSTWDRKRTVRGKKTKKISNIDKEKFIKEK